MSLLILMILKFDMYNIFNLKFLVCLESIFEKVLEDRKYFFSLNFYRLEKQEKLGI